jgi:ANTAR domain
MNHNRYTDTLSRSVIDVAVGVLVGLRGCSEREAFNEIADAVRETGVGLGSLSRALVALASGTTDPFDHRTEAIGLWGELVAGRESAREPIA